MTIQGKALLVLFAAALVGSLVVPLVVDRRSRPGRGPGPGVAQAPRAHHILPGHRGSKAAPALRPAARPTEEVVSAPELVIRQPPAPDVRSAPQEPAREPTRDVEARRPVGAASRIPGPEATGRDAADVRRRALVQQGRDLAARGSTAESITALEKALAIRDSAMVRGMLAVQCAKAGRKKDAVRHLRLASDLAGDVAWYAYERGRLLLEMGQTGDACAAFADALRILPGYTQAARQRMLHCSQE